MAQGKIDKQVNVATERRAGCEQEERDGSWRRS